MIPVGQIAAARYDTGATEYCNGVHFFEINLADTVETGTATIPNVNVETAFIISWTSGYDSGNGAFDDYMNVKVWIDSCNSVKAERVPETVANGTAGTGTVSGDIFIKGYVVDATSFLVKSVQWVDITWDDDSSLTQTATINAVTTANSVILDMGGMWEFGSHQPCYDAVGLYWEFNSTTEIQGTRITGDTNPTQKKLCVVEFQSSMATIQRVEWQTDSNVNDYNDHAISAVTLARTVVLNGGYTFSHRRIPLLPAWELTSSTNLRVHHALDDSPASQAGIGTAWVVEFAAGVLDSVAQYSHSLGTNASGNDTITSVTVADSCVISSGTKYTTDSDDVENCGTTLELTQATTILLDKDHTLDGGDTTYYQVAEWDVRPLPPAPYPSISGGAAHSIQYFEIDVAATSATGTATISEVGSKAVIMCPPTVDWSTGLANNDDLRCHVTLTNSTTIAATRTGTDGDIKVRGWIVDFKDTVVESVQYKSISWVSGDTATDHTVAITEVNPDNSIIINLSGTIDYTGNLSVPTRANGFWDFNSATEIQFSRNLDGTNASTQQCVVVEFASSAVNSIQKAAFSAALSSATYLSESITEVDTDYTVLFNGGFTASRNDEDSMCGFELTSATEVRLHAGVDNSQTLEGTAFIVEFATGVLDSINHYTHTLGNNASNTDTITSVTTADSTILWNGTTFSGGDNDVDSQAIGIEFNNSTTVDFTRGGAYAAGDVIYYQVAEWTTS